MKKLRLNKAIAIFCIATSLLFIAGAVLITVLRFTSFPTLPREMFDVFLTLVTFQPVINEDINITIAIFCIVDGLLVLAFILFLIALARKKKMALLGILAFLLGVDALYSLLLISQSNGVKAFSQNNLAISISVSSVMALTGLLGFVSFGLAIAKAFSSNKVVEEVTVNNEVSEIPELAVETTPVIEPNKEESVQEVKPNEPKVVIVPDTSKEIVINIVTNSTHKGPTKVVRTTPKKVEAKPVQQTKKVEPAPQAQPVKENTPTKEPTKIVKKVVKKVVVKKEVPEGDNGRPKPIPPSNRQKAPTVKIKRVKQDKPTQVTSKPVKGDFKERILAQTKDIQKLYNALKSNIFQYAVKSRIEDENEVIHYEDDVYMLIAVLGTKLKVYYALNPIPYLKTTQPAVDASKHQKYVNTPTEFSIKDERDLKRALELVEDLMVNKGRRKGKYIETDWVKELKNKK